MSQTPNQNDPAEATRSTSETPSPGCMSEADLIPLAHGEPASLAAWSHIADCASCQTRLSRLRAEVRAVRGVESNVLPAAGAEGGLHAGLGELEPIGRYKVLRALDRGGQASVFLAEHPTLGLPVVVKWSLAPLPQDEFDHDRLVAEARLLSELNHPNLARVYDLDTHKERPFVAMEYVRGRTLSQYAADGKPSAAEAAALIAKVARAAAVAHRKGITHRDITPRNVMVDEAGEPRLIDFGLAFVRRAHAGIHSPEIEPAGTVAGTPGFMAPEQEAGQTGRIGPRTDVYALGGLLRFLLLAAPAKAVARPGGEPDTLQPVRAVLPPMLETIPGSPEDMDRLTCAGTPPAVRRVVARAMAADPAARYATADELAGELERVGRTGGRAKRWAAWGGAAAAVLLLAFAPNWMRGPARTGIEGHEGSKPATGLTREAIIARSSPSVFKVIAFGDLTARTPYFARAITIEGTPRINLKRYTKGYVPDVNPAEDGPTIVENEYKRDRAAGVIPKDKDQVTYCYEKLIADPARYLVPEQNCPDGQEPEHFFNAEEEQAVKAEYTWSNFARLRQAPYASGTAFAVSREGVLLTNAHVVGKPDEVPPLVVLPALGRTFEVLAKQFGGPCPYELRARLMPALGGYLTENSKVIYSKFARAVVVLDYVDNEDDHYHRRQDGTAELADFLAFDGPRDNGMGGCVADVLSPLGEEFPGKDVAVLKLRSDGTGIAGSAGAVPQKGRNRDWKDKLVCLPLGDSDRFVLGGNVVAMGFPGAAVEFGAGVLRESAAYHVIPQDGTISAREPTRRGWDALHLTATINHGHSGGPVLDHDGNVVGINVAGTAPGYALVVPINVAKEFLARAGVTPDPGPATEHWLAGHRLNASGRYADAAAEFESVARLQGEPAPATTTSGKPADTVGAFSDVHRALRECHKRLKAE